MKARNFDKKFDSDKQDIIDDLDLSTLKRPNQKQKRINVDFPSWVVESLDREASRVGVTRQSIIKLWLVERLEEKAR
jgi:predicted DNA binding CopG/RHH family protein